MEATIHPHSTLFLDTSYAIALSSRQDIHHVSAVELSLKLDVIPAKLLTTCGVLMEIGNSLSKLHQRTKANELQTAIEFDERIEIIEIDKSRYLEGLKLYHSRPDKEWGLVDCCSFCIMLERNMTEALTADRHFVQAGFTAMLLC